MNKIDKIQRIISNLRNKTRKKSAGRNRYNMIQRKLYRYLVKQEGDINYIDGYLNYVKSINIKQYMQLKATYSRYDKKQMIFKD